MYLKNAEPFPKILIDIKNNNMFYHFSQKNNCEKKPLPEEITWDTFALLVKLINVKEVKHKCLYRIRFTRNPSLRLTA